MMSQLGEQGPGAQGRRLLHMASFISSVTDGRTRRRLLSTAVQGLWLVEGVTALLLHVLPWTVGG